MSLSALVALVVFVLAAFVVYESSRPGSRRCGRRPSYNGPERRMDMTEVDFLNQPMFTKRRCKDCDTLLKRESCKKSNCRK